MFGITIVMSSPTPDVALITGAGRGIGLATARRLAELGWHVVLTDRDGTAARAGADQLVQAGLAASAETLDVTDASRVEAVTAKTILAHSRIDALINNAGMLRDRPLLEMTDADFTDVIEVSLLGAFRLSRAVAASMIQAGYGRIVNVASRAYLGNPGQANYSAAKAGLIGLTKALAKELGRSQITVNAVAPGMVETEMVRSHPEFDAIVARAVKANSVPRIGQPDDIAEAIAYLCSRRAGYITGDVLHVTGGRFG